MTVSFVSPLTDSFSSLVMWNMKASRNALIEVQDRGEEKETEKLIKEPRLSRKLLLLYTHTFLVLAALWGVEPL